MRPRNTKIYEDLDGVGRAAKRTVQAQDLSENEDEDLASWFGVSA
jgi:hypothetical protein